MMKKCEKKPIGEKKIESRKIKSKKLKSFSGKIQNPLELFLKVFYNSNTKVVESGAKCGEVSEKSENRPQSRKNTVEIG